MNNVCDCGWLQFLLDSAEKCEGSVEVKGTYHGLPFFIVVAFGANAGLMERYARQGTLKLTKPTKDL